MSTARLRFPDPSSGLGALSTPQTIDDLVSLINLMPLPTDPEARQRALADRRALVSDADRICRLVIDSAESEASKTPSGGEIRKQVSIDEFMSIKQKLRTFGKSRQLSPKSIDRLRNNRTRLMRAARRFGWSPTISPLEIEWAPLKKAAFGIHGVGDLIDHAIARGRHTWEYTQADQDDWAADKREHGCTDSWVRSACKRLRYAVRQANLQDMFPLFDCGLRTLPPARLKFEAMEAPLRRQLLRLFSTRWQYAARLRVTLNRGRERHRIRVFQALCWYAANVQHIDPLISLDQVLNVVVVNGWVLHLAEARECNYTTIKQKLITVHNTLRKHPEYGKQDFKYILDALKLVKAEPKSAISARATARITDYKNLLLIIPKMRLARLAAMAKGLTREAAWLMHDQLLFMFLVLAQWTGICVRACRIVQPGANLFQDQLLEEEMPADIQDWAKDLWDNDHSVRLWQYRFHPLETPMRASIQGILHNFLTPLLESFVTRYRGILLEGKSDPGTLFFNRNLKPLNVVDLAELIGNLTSKHLDSRKRILPSALRTIFAKHWNRKHPGKHVQLARILVQGVTYVRKKFHKGPRLRSGGSGTRRNPRVFGNT